MLKVKVAVVGLGWWGRQVVAGLRTSRELEVVRVVDPNREAHAAAAAEWGVPLSEQLVEALSDGSVEAVVLCTPRAVR